MTAMVYLGATGEGNLSNFYLPIFIPKKMTPFLELVGADLSPVA